MLIEHVNGAGIGDEAFVATGASLFPGSRLGAGAEIRINGVLHVNSTLAAGAGGSMPRNSGAGAQ